MPAGAEDTLAVILAGGAGVRVGGADKGLLPLLGRPLIEHVFERVHPQGGEALIVANRNVDAYADYAPVVRDAAQGHAGPLAGLVAAFGFLLANSHALPRWLLTAPVDCPDPPRDLASRLRIALMAQAGAECACARHAGKQQPLFALYRVDAAPERWRASAQAALDEHGSACRWQASLRAVVVDFEDDADTFHNLNMAADFHEYERRHAAT